MGWNHQLVLVCLRSIAQKAVLFVHQNHIISCWNYLQLGHCWVPYDFQSFLATLICTYTCYSYNEAVPFGTEILPAGSPEKYHRKEKRRKNIDPKHQFFGFKMSGFQGVMLGDGFKYFSGSSFSPRTLGKISNLTLIFFKWVGSTTN